MLGKKSSDYLHIIDAYYVLKGEKEGKSEEKGKKPNEKRPSHAVRLYMTLRLAYGT